MLFRYKKNLNVYKVLEKVNVDKAELDFGKALKNKHILNAPYTVMGESCTVLYDDSEKVIYHYYGQYAYRLFCVYKKQLKKAIFLGYAGAYACYFHDKIFTIGDGELLIGKHYMTMIDPKTGERQHFEFLGKGVKQVGALGMVSSYCQDFILDMKVSANAITLKIRRRKAELPAGTSDPYNEDLDYLLQIQYQNGQFAATRISPEAIVRRGPWNDSEKNPWSNAQTNSDN